MWGLKVTLNMLLSSSLLSPYQMNSMLEFKMRHNWCLAVSLSLSLHRLSNCKCDEELQVKPFHSHTHTHLLHQTCSAVVLASSPLYPHNFTFWTTDYAHCTSIRPFIHTTSHIAFISPLLSSTCLSLSLALSHPSANSVTFICHFTLALLFYYAVFSLSSVFYITHTFSFLPLPLSSPHDDD